VIDDLERDLRRADVEEAERLLAAADRAGLAPLPSLLLVDLCVLNAHRQSLFDESALDTWAALTGPARERFGGEAIGGLVERGLLGREPARRYGVQEPTRLRMHPALAMILATRAKPVWLAVCSITGTASTGPRLYGLGTAVEPLRAAVLEMPRDPAPTEPAAPNLADLGKVYDYALAGTVKAADVLASWATKQMPGTALAHRQVDVYHHQEGRSLARVRVRVELAGQPHPARVSIGEGETARSLGDYDRAALADLLHDVIRRYA
jgi:hypothetical protein